MTPEQHPYAPFVVLAIGGPVLFLRLHRTGRLDRARAWTLVFGLVGYELSNALFGHPVDPFDIAATLVCGVAAVPLYLFIHRQRESSS